VPRDDSGRVRSDRVGRTLGGRSGSQAWAEASVLAAGRRSGDASRLLSPSPAQAAPS